MRGRALAAGSVADQCEPAGAEDRIGQLAHRVVALITTH